MSGVYAVVLKPDPRTAVCGGVVLARVFEEAGLPAGLLHVLPGGPQAGEALITEPLVRIISFTGSTAAGRRVGELTARHLKRVHLELGGNSALIILDDADLDRAASAGAFGSFLHQGQICMTTGRHLVHEAVYDDYVAALAAKAAHLPVGDPASGQVALGPVIDERQRDKIHALVTGSTGAGARLAAGGTYQGLFYQPTVLAEVTPDMPAWASEVFGPVAPVLKFATPEEAAALAADSEYGLSLGILTRDVMRGLDLARRIPTGIVHINEQTVDDEPNVPFGGLLASGTGARFGGTANLDAFTETRWVTIRGDIAPTPSDPDRYARLMNTRPVLALPEWTVLAVLSQQPAHGFAVAQLTAPCGELGRVWQIPRPVIYRAIGRLTEAGLIRPQSVEPGLGPQRTIYAATPTGHQAAQRWLDTPVEHVRDIRSHLLLKLALLDRAGADPVGLLRRQRTVLEPIAQAIEAEPPPREGFDATLLAWRRATATAALDFLDTITGHESQPGARHG